MRPYSACEHFPGRLHARRGHPHRAPRPRFGGGGGAGLQPDRDVRGVPACRSRHPGARPPVRPPGRAAPRLRQPHPLTGHLGAGTRLKGLRAWDRVVFPRAELDMSRRVAVILTVFVFAIGVAAPVAVPSAEERPGAADLALGLKQAEDGDYSLAVITLDRAARALAGEPGRARELGQAYLYLGIAYVGLGSETVAKAKFREALGQVSDLSLNPEQFPPKVIELFEKARDESRANVAATSAEAVAARAAPADGPAANRGRSKLPLVLIGVGGAAAAGIAVAAGGGSSPATTMPSATTETLSGGVSCGNSDTVNHRIVAARAGTLDALLSWTDRDHPITMFLSNIESTSASAVV